MEELDLMQGRRETFSVKLNDFEGPMDLLLDLIAKAEIRIRDVFVSNVTDQYLEYINTLEHLDIEKASSFVTYAARILDIKVRSLLPQTEEEIVLLEEEKEIFFSELEMRQVFLDAKRQLSVRETVNVFRVEPEYTKADYRLVIADEEFNMDALADAFARIMHRFQMNKEKKTNTKVVVKDRFTVVDKTKELISLLKEKRSLTFSSLFEAPDGGLADFTVGERINTFLAILELTKRQFAVIAQEEEFGEIAISLAEGADDITYESIVGGGDYADYEYEEKKHEKKSN